jgi:hypothetical protein
VCRAGRSRSPRWRCVREVCVPRAMARATTRRGGAPRARVGPCRSGIYRAGTNKLRSSAIDLVRSVRCGPRAVVRASEQPR